MSQKPFILGVNLVSLHIVIVSFVTFFWFVSAHADSIVSIKGDRRIIAQNDYDYAPSVLLESDKYKMYWCAKGEKGDEIFYSEARVNTNQWTKPLSVLGPQKIIDRGASNRFLFDSLHVCDPSVLRVRDKYYLYYGGLSTLPGASKNCQTKIGVAESKNGLDWVRMNGGEPIVMPERDCPKNQYGVGQPSVVFLGGYFYMIYTDTAGFRSNPKNGAGLYVIRSKDPTFNNREVITSAGWRLATRVKRVTEHKVVDGFSADLMYSDIAKSFILSLHYQSGFTIVRFLDDNFRVVWPDVEIKGDWRDGAGFLRKPDGHALPSSTCNELPLSLVRAKGESSPATWDLFFTEVSVTLDKGRLICSTDRIQQAFSGFLVSAEGLPSAMITGLGRVQLDSPKPLFGSNYSSIAVEKDLYLKFPYLGDIKHRQPALSGEGLPNAIITTLGYRVQYQCVMPVLSNQSPQSRVSRQRFHNYPLGGEVFCDSSVVLH